MRYTINFQHHAAGAKVAAGVGMVEFNGAWLLPYEAAMLADALAECAQRAETKAAEAAANMVPALDWQPEPDGAWVAADAAIMKANKAKRAAA